VGPGRLPQPGVDQQRPAQDAALLHGWVGNWGLAIILLTISSAARCSRSTATRASAWAISRRRWPSSSPSWTT
jgi:hypothetical protein